MLKKFVTIQNVGRFWKYGAAGNVELKRYSVISAENGRGKTTLCAILRSLQSGVAAHVLGRQTLGSPDAPEIRIVRDSGTLTFSNGAWSATVPEIAIFDATFVAENVFSGDTVDVAHKRSLYRVIVGRDGVTLAKEIEDLDAASRAKATDIREKAAPLQALLPRGTTLEAFLGFAEDAAIDAKTAATERELEAVRQATEIAARATLSAVTVPVLPAGFAALLTRTVEGVAEDAEKRVAAQVAAHGMGRAGEEWLGQGLGFVNEAGCPFCAQDLAPAAALLNTYTTYFSQAYNQLPAAIGAMRANIETALGDRQIAAFERTIDQNAAGLEFWSRFAELPALPREAGAGEALRALRQAALAQLDRKAAAPLAPIEPDAAFAAAAAGADRLLNAAITYNAAVATANAALTIKKEQTGAADVRTVETQLALQRLIKKRHDPATRDVCAAYQKAVEEKAGIERQKETVKDKLDEYTRGVIGIYEQTINRLLGEFHAGFTITSTEHGYPGGVASSNYQILINGTPVELGDERTPLDRPSFRNTLSAGDRSTLALAFFLAQIEQDPERASKIVVFDDPFNSQDSFRKDHTARKIRDCGESCAQVIVLSHDPYFLKRLWERLQEKTAERKSLELRRLGLTNTAILEWDVEAATQGAYKADRKVLTDYYHEGIGELRHVVQKIRPALEYYTKILGAGALADNDTLGVIVGKIRGVGPGHQLFPHCDELDNLNVYTRRYHHGENPDAATEPINDGELHGYVRRTLELTGGC